MVHTLDTAPHRSESPPQKRSGMARVLKGFHSFTCTPTRSSTIGMDHTCLCLPSYSWYSFTNPGGIEGGVLYNCIILLCSGCNCNRTRPREFRALNGNRTKVARSQTRCSRIAVVVTASLM